MKYIFRLLIVLLFLPYGLMLLTAASFFMLISCIQMPFLYMIYGKVYSEDLVFDWFIDHGLDLSDGIITWLKNKNWL